MATALSSDITPDTARFPYTMVVGDAHQMSSTRSESTQSLSALSHASRLPNAPTTQARYPSTSATTTPFAITNSSNRAFSTPHTVPSSTPVPVPQSRNTVQTHIPEPASHYPSQQYDAHTAAQGYEQNPRQLARVFEGSMATPPSPRLQPTHHSLLSFNGSGSTSPNRIKVRDLNHIQSFASEEMLTRSNNGSRHSLRGRQDGVQQYEISAMPVTDIIEMVAGLLTKITTTNDRQHEHLHRHIPPPEGTTGLTQQATSVLAFHGKNVPSITIMSYLSRIHKYCPTTYEVFLSLLVYFDRMTEMVNSGLAHNNQDNGDFQRPARRPPSSASSADSSARTLVATPPLSDPSEPDDQPALSHSPSMPPALPSDADAYNLSHFFVVDSFNIHRLVIAGVTCASKFFSDVFYTNSRYAKVGYSAVFCGDVLNKSQVGGLPLVELNHLELQFLLLNDFRLSVPVEELEAYGTMLVEFYAREVVAQQEGLYMQTPTPP